jgi:23S rRNA (guanosine2251-2'-O)-methyltransferase
MSPGRRDRRSESREVVVVGRRPVLEAVRSGAAREVFVATGSRATPGMREVLRAAEGAGVPVAEVPEGRVAGLAGETRHQGVAARLRRPRELTEGDLTRWDWPEEAVVLVLDGVTDPHNLGACARTAEAAGASALVIRRRRGAALTTVALKSSAGALAHLPVATVPNLPRALNHLKEDGFWVVGLDGRAGRSIGESVRPPGRLALVLGSEGSGLSRLVAERCDELLAIPLRGHVESLNVSVAAGVALFSYALRPAPT